jgi:hypothetical protein
VKSSDHSWLLRRYFRFSDGVFAKRRITFAASQADRVSCAVGASAELVQLQFLFYLRPKDAGFAAAGAFGAFNGPGVLDV